MPDRYTDRCDHHDNANLALWYPLPIASPRYRAEILKRGGAPACEAPKGGAFHG